MRRERSSAPSVRRRASTRSAIASATPAGSASPRELIGAGKKVFLDLKLHDIGNTVREGVESLARARRDLPDRPRLSADDAGGARRPRPVEPEAPRRDGAHLLRRRRSRARPAMRNPSTTSSRRARPGAGPRHRRHRLRRARGRRGCAAIVGPDRLIVTPGIRPAGAESRRPEAHRDPGRGDPRRRRPHRGRAPDHRRRGPAARRGGDRRGDAAAR